MSSLLIFILLIVLIFCRSDQWKQLYRPFPLLLEHFWRIFISSLLIFISSIVRTLLDKSPPFLLLFFSCSVISPQPFSGSEANMMSLFEKNDKALKEMQARLAHITEPDMMLISFA